MIIHEYQCELCEDVTEHLVESDNIPDITHCPICNGNAVRIVSISHTAPVDSAWISDVLEVVNKKSPDAHCKEFLRHPTRSNYKAWMKGEGLRPLEDGERVMPEDTSKERLADKKKQMHKLYKERNAITING